ncbi:hypothetical protein [Flagellimonas zhangzhouensis]|uniref:Uncharacterized protein n=1 Tax=Flagellimonas zhangzhouensis TaxID=1073328 RepID=A0A1H2USV3_9FLAO|nr:hypothetical protein [Allomuricauda zhangzhouensis]SDQ14083.1 hypothetical protein SAMN05216294_0550 [Allomuricauda zhangzhouensis]SDW59145.1 hypothetical protein SAMN04487892_1742 [Allomuricauda zhangzhouensis]
MILEPIERTDLAPKTKELYDQFEQLTLEIKKKRLPEEVVFDINKHINELNAETDSDKLLRKLIRKKQSGILELLEKKLKIVTINHFRNKWMALGMLVFGIPIGTALGSSLGNMAFLGIGIPIGLSVGLAVGNGMDKKAFEEGRQLDIEIKR